ncbi:MAG: outer membrane lipoprotein-sorting protein [Calditrichia bacterium]
MKNLKIALCLFSICLITLASAQTDAPTAEEILKKLDDNVLSKSRVFQSSMIINGRRAKRKVSSKSWIEGEDRSFTEYVAPAREKGTKMLKLDDQLWTYSPSTDRTIRISGHMLRQSVMGSDLSYEDMMEDRSLLDAYNCAIVGTDSVNGRPCWILDLTAKEKDVAYAQRKLWVDKERYLGLKEERYARSGKLLKTTEIKDMKRVGNRWVVTHVIFKDMLKKGEGTEFLIEDIEFDVDIPGHVFSKASLRR